MLQLTDVQKELNACKQRESDLVDMLCQAEAVANDAMSQLSAAKAELSEMRAQSTQCIATLICEEKRGQV